VGNVIPTGSVFCLLGILRMSYALVTPRRRGDVRNNSRMLPSSAGRSMRNAPKSTNYILINKIILYKNNYILINKIILYKNKKVNKKGYNPLIRT